MTNPLLAILVALVLAYILSEIFRSFKIPRVIGQILAGIVLGVPLIKSVLFTDEVSPVFSFITNIGIILLFFFVGLEINLFQFRKNFKESSLIALFNTIIPLAAGFFVGKLLFKFNNITSIIIGISLSVSSQAISLDILEELRLLKSKIGNLILISAAVDDVFELLLISSILVMFHSTKLGSISLQKLMIDILAFILILIIIRILLIPFTLRIFEKEKSQASLFMGALIIVLFMTYISELFGVGSLIGALIAGILVRQTLITGENRKPWRKNELSHLIHTLSFGFLIPIFFVNVGLSIDLSSLSSNIFLVVVLVLIDIIGTLIGTMIGVLLSKGSLMEGLIVGLGVVPKGDTEIVIATLALNSGLIDKGIFTAIVTVALVCTFLAPIAFKILIKRHSVEVS